MDEMLGYIFGSLHCSERDIRSIRKNLRKQYKLNKHVTLCLALLTLNVVLSYREERDQKRKIRDLEKKIKELEERAESVTEGE